MDQKGVQLDQGTFSCLVCLDLLKHPVTVPCGHSYCMNCIHSHWDKEVENREYSCPQCKQTFTLRPVLEKNSMLEALVEKLKTTGPQAAPADQSYAGPEDVACDVCTGRKRKACKSCLQCLVSYCEKDIKPHFESPVFKKHKLMEPSMRLQESICSVHDEVMKLFCRTDQQCICYLCVMDEHKSHDTVTAAAERTERQKELKTSSRNIQRRIRYRENDAKRLQREVDATNGSADKAVEHIEKRFNHLIRVMEKRRSELKEQVRSQQETEVSRFKELQEKVEQEITELKGKDAELQKLSLTEDHNQFLLDYPSLSTLSESTQSPSSDNSDASPLKHFEDVTAAVTEVSYKILNVLREKWTATDVDVSLSSKPEPTTRSQFLKYSCDLTLDPNTAHTQLILSDGNKKVKLMTQHQPYSCHTDRFRDRWQVLSRETLAERCYWEVECKGKVFVSIAYKSIKRKGSSDECVFGCNEKSWALHCYKTGYDFWYNKVSTPVSGCWSPRIGVYLDQKAGVLSFYSVADTMNLLHRVQTTFTEPLHAGLWLYWSSGSNAEFCKPKKW
ncbi:tripartite motif-containing protein 16-like [Notolabrus celidotus]|uniref:tripartite motif-containing protein 16-like n=1 Tax=Notolabrus celidotus TaxID=1203425 RepID=UPI00148FE709|nr:tripartite motif-containing protein 16-like [Notolabrus celidotus]XP_034559690.1 tripartite motif-containing protein 16-like [Notolabrus celidotus]